MEITILYFQTLKDKTGTESEKFPLGDGDTVASVVDRLMTQHQALAAYRPSLMLAVNEEWAAPDYTLRDGDTLALMPPVSGG